MKINPQNNINHARCVRDVEMEIRFKDKCPKYDDEFNDVREYIRSVLIYKINQDDVITDFYNRLTKMIKEASFGL